MLTAPNFAEGRYQKSPQLGEFRVASPCELLVLDDLFLERFPPGVVGEKLFQALKFAGQIAGAALVGVHSGVGEFGLQFGRPFAEFVDIGEHVHGAKKKDSANPQRVSAESSVKISYLALA